MPETYTLENLHINGRDLMRLDTDTWEVSYYRRARDGRGVKSRARGANEPTRVANVFLTLTEAVLFAVAMTQNEEFDGERTDILAVLRAGAEAFPSRP